MMRRWLIVILVLAVLASAVASVVSRHETRKAFAELQQIDNQHDELQVEFGRLQLEQATWAEYGRVETLARERLNMSQPQPAEQVVVHYEP